MIRQKAPGPPPATADMSISGRIQLGHAGFPSKHRADPEHLQPSRLARPVLLRRSGDGSSRCSGEFRSSVSDGNNMNPTEPAPMFRLFRLSRERPDRWQQPGTRPTCGAGHGHAARRRRCPRSVRASGCSCGGQALDLRRFVRNTERRSGCFAPGRARPGARGASVLRESHLMRGASGERIELRDPHRDGAEAPSFDRAGSLLPLAASEDDVGPAPVTAPSQTAGPRGACSGTDIVSASRS